MRRILIAGALSLASLASAGIPVHIAKMVPMTAPAAPREVRRRFSGLLNIAYGYRIPKRGWTVAHDRRQARKRRNQQRHKRNTRH